MFTFESETRQLTINLKRGLIFYNGVVLFVVNSERGIAWDRPHLIGRVPQNEVTPPGGDTYSHLVRKMLDIHNDARAIWWQISIANKRYLRFHL